LDKKIYKDLLGDKLVYAKSSKGPHFQFSYSKIDDYQENLNEYFIKNPGVREVPVEPVTDPEFFGPLVNFLFPILMFGLLMVLMMRKMGGWFWRCRRWGNFQYWKVQGPIVRTREQK